MATKTLAQLTKELSTSQKEIASLTSQISTLSTEKEQISALLQERQRLLEYVASILLDIQANLEKYPSLLNIPSKIKFFWVLQNLGSIVSFLTFLISKIKEFAQNIKVNKDAPAQ